MPERNQARRSHQQVEGKAVDDPDQDFDADVLEEADRLDPQRHGGKNSEQHQHLRSYEPRNRVAEHAYTSSRLRLPNRPRARNVTTSTSRM